MVEEKNKHFIFEKKRLNPQNKDSSFFADDKDFWLIVKKFILFSLLHFSFFMTISCVTNISKRSIKRKIGSRDMLICSAITPKSGGIIKNPVYANAICTPIIACEFSAPNTSGVI